MWTEKQSKVHVFIYVDYNHTAYFHLFLRPRAMFWIHLHILGIPSANRFMLIGYSTKLPHSKYKYILQFLLLFIIRHNAH